MAKNIISRSPVSVYTPEPVVMIFFLDERNVFMDEWGNVIYNPFEILSPEDVYLFRHDQGNCVFPYKPDPSILCEIVPISKEDWWWSHDR